jgi:signal transduction histidine kinase
MKKRLILGWLLLITSVMSHGDYRISLVDQDRYILSQSMAYLEDHSNSLSINDVSTYGPSKWTINSDSSSSFGYSESTYWFHVPFAVEHSALWYVWLRYAPLDYVTFYWVKNGRVIDTYQSGDAIVFSERQVHFPENASFRFLEKGEQIDLYIQIKTDGSYRIPLEIHQSQSFDSNISQLSTFQGIYYGVLIVMSLFNFVLYFITGIRPYFYYVLYVAGSLFTRLTIDGTGFQFLWSNTPAFNQWAVPISFWLNSVTFLMFSYVFLNINKGNTSVRKYFGLLAILLAAIGLAMPFLSYQSFVPMITLYSTLLLISSLIASMVLTLSGYRYAGVFAIAIMMATVAFGLSVAESLGHFSDQTFMLYGYPAARILEIILFAVALGARIRFLQERKTLAENEAILHRESSIKSNEQYKRLYETAMTGNFVLDGNGYVKSANDAFYKLLGGDVNYNVQQYFDRDLSNIFRKGPKEYDYKIIKEIKGKNGKWFSANINRITIKNETQYEGSLVDISDRVEAEEIQRLAEKNKMQALQQLVVGVAHEINTPLGIVRTSSDLARELVTQMQGSIENNELTKNDLIEKLSASDEALQLSDSSLLRMVELIQSFKKVSVQQMGLEIEPLNLESISARLKDSARIQSMPLSIGINNTSSKLSHTFSEGIYWSLNELLCNACDHGGNKEGVFIDFELDEKTLSIHFYNSGVGVDAKNLPLIFDPFFTTGRGVGRKLGLGLYQTQNIIVQLLHGTINAYNENGLNFDINIPLSLRELPNN